MSASWFRFQQDLALASFIAGCTMAEMALRLCAVPAHPAPLRLPRLRLVSDLHGIEIDPDFIKDA